MISDWLSAGALIKTRVTAQVAGLARVDIVSGVEEAARIVKDDKSCFVAWGGDSTIDSAGHGAVAKAAQRWIVMIAVRPGQTPGALLSKIITALSGYELSDSFDGLRFSGGSAAVYTGDFALYPLNFELAVFAS
jgi:hypothetical protein